MDESSNVNDCTRSADFIKDLTMSAISYITLTKKSFPVTEYDMRDVSGMPVYMLKNECVDAKAQSISNAIRFSFDAIDKKYLQKLSLCFFKEGSSPENLLEYYLFQYDYGNEQTLQSNMEFTAGEILKSIANMIGACAKTSRNYAPLPEGYNIIIKLFYNTDTPQEYNPQDPSMDKITIKLLVLNAKNSITKVPIITTYHKLSVSSFSTVDGGEFRPDTEDLLTPEIKLLCPCNDIGKSSFFVKNINNSKTLLIKCIYCNLYQHATCFGVLPEDTTRRSLHCCNRCYDVDNFRSLTGWRTFDGKEKVLYMYRHVLYLCTQLKTINIVQLKKYFGLSDKDAMVMYTILLNSDIIKSTDFGSKTPHKIRKRVLKKEMFKYFYSPNNKSPEQSEAESESETSSSHSSETESGTENQSDSE